MQDIRRPQTPLFWVFHLLSANRGREVEIVRKVYTPKSRGLILMLQIRDDHHYEMNRYES